MITAVALNPLGTQGIVLLVVIGLLLMASALISSSETAFFSLTPQHIHHFKMKNTRSTHAVLRLLSMPEYLLATILIANNLVNICVVLLSNTLIDSWVDFQGAETLELVVKLVIVTFILLLFGEIMPKVFASYNAVRVAKMMAVPMLFLRGVFKPFSYLLIRSGNSISARAAKRKVNISMDELSNALEMTSDQSVEEKKILTGIVGFVNTEVAQIMKHRVDMVALDEKEDFDRVREVILSSGFSRIPVYEESMDNIKGVLYVKDLIPHITREASFDWRSLCRKPYFVPEHKKINDLLEEFQTQKVHLGIVVDEYGSTQGLVSLEDILEEIVGEISDESDVEESFYTQVDEHTYLFDGKTNLTDMLKVLDLDDDYLDALKGQAESIGGLMLEIRRDFIRQGDVIYARELTLKAESVEGHRIDKVQVKVGK